MIGLIIELLKYDEYYGVSEDIDLAKGKYKAPKNFGEARKLIKRRKNG